MRLDAHFDLLPERAFARVGGKIQPQGGKGSSNIAAPDFSKLEAASNKATETGAALGRDQLAENKRQFEVNMAANQPVLDAQIALMKSAKEQGDEYYAYQKNTFRPIEQSLADEASSGKSRYDTNADVRAAIERNASRSAADVATANANSTEQMNRQLESMGVNPNSGKFAAMRTGVNLNNAATMAAAETNARDQGVANDWNKRMEVTNLGRNLPGATTNSYQVATGAGNSAVAGQNSTAAQYINGISAGNGTIMQGQGLGIQGLSSMTSSQTSAYNAQQQANASAQAGIGQLAGTALMAGATYAKYSDRRLKQKIVQVGEDPRGFGIYEFAYRHSPDIRYRGVMADEVVQVMPKAVIYGDDGFARVNYGLLGLEMTEVQ